MVTLPDEDIKWASQSCLLFSKSKRVFRRQEVAVAVPVEKTYQHLLALRLLVGR